MSLLGDYGSHSVEDDFETILIQHIDNHISGHMYFLVEADFLNLGTISFLVQ